MATTTVSRGNAPTEAEVRELYRRRPGCEPLDRLEGELADAITHRAADPFDWQPPSPSALEDEPERGNALYTDLRPSEAARLRDLLAGAERQALQAAMEALEREIVDAVLTFAAEHPEATRA